MFTMHLPGVKPGSIPNRWITKCYMDEIAFAMQTIVKRNTL